MSTLPGIHVLGIGSPIVDILFKVKDSFLSDMRIGKGSTVQVDSATCDALLESAGEERFTSAGGSAANTLYAMARLGMRTAFKGVIGDDENGRLFKEEFEQLGCDTSRFRVNPDAPTAVCVIMVTPDTERTMRPNLGASITMTPDDIQASDFDGITHVHLEGYLMRNMDVFKRILEMAYDADCTVSLDLGSHEIVREHRQELPELIEKYISIVFANESEAALWDTETQSWQKGYEMLRKICPVVCIKQGARGAVINCVDEMINVRAQNVTFPADSTAAGDLWAAGFLYGYLQNFSLKLCGECASTMAAEVLKVLGTGSSITDENWEAMMDKMP